MKLTECGKMMERKAVQIATRVKFEGTIENGGF